MLTGNNNFEKPDHLIHFKGLKELIITLDECSLYSGKVPAHEDRVVLAGEVMEKLFGRLETELSDWERPELKLIRTEELGDM